MGETTGVMGKTYGVKGGQWVTYWGHGGRWVTRWVMQ